ncbi:hypothetical protein L3Q82_002485 [Scortum barcoo]|uniref:Uncharacterized protein n=1 Tax=Scortum barcoo TaxID=214431 RepID=A0ACB8VYI1_9TELE|nr:hypothetical protein L3Q82_002485 [Scortum barcoo]
MLFVGLQFSLQHSDPGQADTEAPQPGTALIAVPLDQGLPHQQASGGENRGQHILYTGPEHRHTTGLRAQPSPLHSLHQSSYRTMMRPNTERRLSTLLNGARNNNLLLNTSKTKEVIVDYRRSRRTEHAPLLIHGEAVERVNNIKFLGIHITSDLTWSMNTAHLVKKAQQRLFFLRKLKRAGLSPQLLTNFYRATIEKHPLSSVQQCGMAAALHKTERTCPCELWEVLFQTWTQYTLLAGCRRRPDI